MTTTPGMLRLVFNSGTQSLRVDTVSRPLTEGHTLDVLLQNEGPSQPAEDAFIVTIKRANMPASAPLLTITGFSQVSDYIWRKNGVNFTAPALRDYIGNAETRLVDVEIRDISTNTILGMQNSMPMMRSVYREGDVAPDPELTIAEVVAAAIASGITALKFLHRSADPPQPSEGETVIWASEGTGKGDAGDVMIAATVGGVTKYTTLFDHSAGTDW